jgi:hypothetical protein
MPERWQRIICLMDEAYQQYLTGMVALRERVIADLGHRLSDSSPRTPGRQRHARRE